LDKKPEQCSQKTNKTNKTKKNCDKKFVGVDIPGGIQ